MAPFYLEFTGLNRTFTTGKLTTAAPGLCVSGAARVERLSTVWHNHGMPRQRWYVSGLILGVLILCLAVLGVRWNLLASRVPLSPLPASAAAQAQQVVEEDQPSEAQPAESAQPAAGERRLDLNRASAVELTSLPGIGEVLAARIIEYRDEHGQFRRVADLVEVEGIGECKLAAVEELVYVQPAD